MACLLCYHYLVCVRLVGWSWLISCERILFRVVVDNYIDEDVYFVTSTLLSTTTRNKIPSQERKMSSLVIEFLVPRGAIFTVFDRSPGAKTLKNNDCLRGLTDQSGTSAKTFNFWWKTV